MNFEGDESLLLYKDKFVAIIGPREANDEELKAAYSISKYLVSKGYIVISGLASGVDTFAHRGAIDGNGKTIAILSTSLNESIYPKENICLSNKIINNGLVIFPYKDPAVWGKGFGQPQKRLIERNILAAYICPKIIAVSDNNTIVGGTAWALNYGNDFRKEIWRMDSKLNFHRYPRYEEKQIWWEMELDLSMYD
ncbi:DNA-protecting protein DprA [Tissierella carlieri]|uniref:DNA-protecting protein DprA n=1 Tax=Tissierella carlieri TaxID=689904 RepID=A0ABT1SF93_9FIRM|nr:DNA-processing protein DprA [Tissierella carlieri]MCQ4924945.1 DNA-protecting protein DprA [Tissierella carlieri]